MAKLFIKRSTLTAIADAIRAKKGTADPIAVSDFASEILSITTETLGLSYTIIEDSYGNKYYRCYGIGEATSPNIIIPEKHDGYSVKEIGVEAFEGNETIETLTALYVTRIYERAFQDCTNLKNVSLQNVEQIGSYAFSGCTSLESVVFGKSLQYISDNAFKNCSSLNSITLPKSLLQLGMNVFNGTNVSTIIYEGTMAEWEGVIKTLDTWLGSAPATTVQCSDGTVTITRTLIFQVKLSDTTAVGYSFEDGMSWYNWVASQYNTAGYVIRGYSGKAVVCLMASENTGYALKYNGSFVDPNKDAIIAGTYEREYVYPITSNAPGGST